MTRKKGAIIAVIVCVVAIAAAVFYMMPLIIAQSAIRDVAHSYEPVSSESPDGNYMLKTEKHEDSTVVFATFTIESTADGTVIFRCYDKYRTMDLKSILFDADSNDVYVVSGDVGTIQYKFSNGGWLKDLGNVDRSTDTWSSEFTDPYDKLAFLSGYLISFSEILDAEYHIDYHDNSVGRLAGPSDWDVRVALKIKPKNIALWTAGYENSDPSQIDLDWWDALDSGEIVWDSKDAGYYKRPNSSSYLVAFPDSGIILKAVTTLSYPASAEAD